MISNVSLPRSQQHQCSIAWGVVARRRAGADRWSRGRTGSDADRAHRVPHRLDDEELHGVRRSWCSAIDGCCGSTTSVADIAPEFAAVVGPTTDSPPITVRHLLSMAGGLATDDVWADRHLDVVRRGARRLLSNGATFAWTPQTHGEYSNLGYRDVGPDDPPRHRSTRPRTSSPTTCCDRWRWIARRGCSRTTTTGRAPTTWSTISVSPTSSRSATARSLRWAGCGRASPIWFDWVTWFDDAFPARDDADDGPLCRASRREMQQVHPAWPTVHTPAVGRGRRRGSRADRRRWLRLRAVRSARHPLRALRATTPAVLPGYGSNMRWLPGRRIGVIALGNCDLRADVGDGPRMLEIVDDHGLIPATSCRAERGAGRCRPAPGGAAVGLDRRRADELFADNVALDESFSRRARQQPRWRPPTERSPW